MKKIFSIVLALVLVLGLSLATTTSVAATVHDVSVVDVDPQTVGMAANYTIVFNITSTLEVGSGMIYIEFPSDTTVPTTYARGDVTVQGEDVFTLDIEGDDQVVSIRTPVHISTSDPKVTVVFNVSAGIINPTTPGDKYLNVWTSREDTPVPSDPYTIVLPDKSMYEFVYEPEPDKMTIYEAEPATLNVTLKTKVLGLEGYNSTRIVFNVTDEHPPLSAVTFQVYDDDVDEWRPVSPLVDHGQWPVTGNFSVSEAHNETFPFRLTFSKVGLYTIKFVLDDLYGADDLIEEEISFAVTGVSYDVPLNKGWNLMSLPIVPDDSTIAAVLASIENEFISVHHYDPLAPGDHWLIYAPAQGDFYTLTDMKDGKAYWINMSLAANLTVVGQAVAPPGYGPPPPSYSVVEGWNMVGFREMESMEVRVYLDGTDFVRVYGFDLGQNGWFPVTQNMTPGLGYWVAFSNDGIIYP